MRRILIAAVLVGAGATWVVIFSAQSHSIVPPEVPQPQEPLSRPPGLDWTTCESVTDLPSAPAGSLPALIEAELYRRIIEASPHYTEPSTLVVENRTIPAPKRALDSSQVASWPEAAAQLAWKGMFDCFALTSDRLPRGAQLVSPELIPRKGDALATKFPGAVQTFAFSRAVLDERWENAIVVYSRLCFAGCGISEWVWLRKESDGHWKIAGRTWRWIN